MAHLTISLIGNRDLRQDQLASLRNLARQALSEYEQAPSATFYSSLAEGADRLLADVAIELNLRVVAVLPAHRSVYCKDFPESAGEFDRLLARCASVVEFPGMNWPLSADEYQHAARWMLDQSTDVICICDSAGGGARGGTLDSINYAKTQCEVERLIWIHCTRASNHVVGEVQAPNLEHVKLRRKEEI